MKQSIQTLRNEQGFTLVELAVVMIIIGILIGGILKGQELITNARVTSTVSQMEAIGAAKNDFQNQYNSLPGDMNDASTRLTNCGAAACTDGNGNGTLGTAVGAAPTGEGLGFFLHLLGAGYITGMDGSVPATAAFGSTLPTAPIGGGFTAGQYAAVAPTGFANTMPRGVYVVQTNAVTAVGANTGIMSGLQASRVDTKLDDGVPDIGTVRGDNAGCTVAGAPATYTAVAAATCSVAYKI